MNISGCSPGSWAGGPRGRGGFALVEAAALVGVVGVLVLVLAVVAHENRRVATLSASKANLAAHGVWTANYASDNEDRIWAFWWEPGPDGTQSKFPDLNGHLDGQDRILAAANQAVDIIRRRSSLTEFPPISLWVPHILFSHLVLADYLDSPAVIAQTVSPADRLRLAWRRSLDEDPTGAAFLALDARPPGDTQDRLRWIFSSSYELGPAFWSQDQGGTSGSTAAQTGGHGFYFAGTLPLGGRLLSEVAYPSHKVMVYDQYQRHFGSRVAYFAYTEARTPMLMADGSVGVRTTAEANEGFRPNSPQQSFPTWFNYSPNPAWEPPTLSGEPSETVLGHYRWTRGGLAGRDFEGPEVNTGQP